MYVYTPGQWALLFFFYCFCGWVWESCYVSAKQRHWVNRGFLHGPLLPIYGSGAIIILFATLPVADNFWLVYFLGMLAATALEYVSSAGLRLFLILQKMTTAKKGSLRLIGMRNVVRETFSLTGFNALFKIEDAK